MFLTTASPSIAKVTKARALKIAPAIDRPIEMKTYSWIRALLSAPKEASKSSYVIKEKKSVITGKKSPSRMANKRLSAKRHFSSFKKGRILPNETSSISSYFLSSTSYWFLSETTPLEQTDTAFFYISGSFSCISTSFSSLKLLM